MKVVHIFSLGNICYEYSQNMHMFLTHMVERYAPYRRVAQECSGYKILDNSLIELGGAVEIERVLDAAANIGADEIILPDVFQNGPETLKAVEKAIEKMWEIWPTGDWPYKLMAVAQGKDEEEWIQCYRKLLLKSEVDVIGIPKVLAKMVPGGRPYMVNTHCNLEAKPHHLLGVWYSFTELKEYKRPGDIRSVDSVLMSFMAKYGLDVHEGVRPDGFTIDLEADVVDYSKVKF